MLHVDATLDAQGLSCPLPILKAKKALASLRPGQTLRVVASDPGAVPDFANFCQQTGHALLESRSEQGRFIFVLRKRTADSAA